MQYPEVVDIFFRDVIIYPMINIIHQIQPFTYIFYFILIRLCIKIIFYTTPIFY